MSFGRPLRTCLPGIPITHCLKSSFLFALSLLETYSVLHITTWTPAATLEQPIDPSSSTSYLCTNQCAHNCSLLQASNTWGNLTRTHSMAFGLRILTSALLSYIIWWGHQPIYWMPCSEEWSNPLHIFSLGPVPTLAVPINFRHFHESHY